MKSFGILVLGFLLTPLLRVGAAMNRPVESPAVNLPRTLGIWTRSDEVRKILPAKIFDYMDGAGELYLGYRFSHLEVAEYSAPDEDQILVELYWMESSDDAFGLLSGDWGGDPVDPDAAAARQEGPAWLPDRRALYGAGLLRIWSDDLYARVMAYRESARSKEAVLRLGRLIMAGRKRSPAPAFLDALPREVSAGFRFRTDRFCYFRSHLVLNSIYFLSTRNILDLDRSSEAVTASYVRTSGDTARGSVQLILIRYASEASAKKGLVHFEQAYLPEKHKSSPEPKSDGARIRRIEDGWVGYDMRGRFLVLAFECPDRNSAAQFINESIKRLDGLEARHE